MHVFQLKLFSFNLTEPTHQCTPADISMTHYAGISLSTGIEMKTLKGNTSENTSRRISYQREGFVGPWEDARGLPWKL